MKRCECDHAESFGWREARVFLLTGGTFMAVIVLAVVAPWVLA